MILVRELVAGSRHFNELRRGLPLKRRLPLWLQRSAQARLGAASGAVVLAVA